MRRSEEERGAKKREAAAGWESPDEGAGWSEPGWRAHTGSTGQMSTGSTVEAGCVSEGRRREEEVEFGAAFPRIGGSAGTQRPLLHSPTPIYGVLVRTHLEGSTPTSPITGLV